MEENQESQQLDLAATAQPDAEPTVEETPSRRGLRFAIWGVALAFFAGFLSLVRVHTYLGVEADAWDKNGRDYVWSVWWRARHDMIGAAPSTAFVVVYLGLIAAFLVLSGLALWIAVVADEPASGADDAAVNPLSAL